GLAREPPSAPTAPKIPIPHATIAPALHFDILQFDLGHYAAPSHGGRGLPRPCNDLNVAVLFDSDLGDIEPCVLNAFYGSRDVALCKSAASCATCEHGLTSGRAPHFGLLSATGGLDYRSRRLTGVSRARERSEADEQQEDTGGAVAICSCSNTPPRRRLRKRHAANREETPPNCSCLGALALAWD